VAVPVCGLILILSGSNAVIEPDKPGLLSRD